MPRPSKGWGQGARPTSSRSGFSNASGSRLAAPISTTTLSRARSSTPFTAQSARAPDGRPHRGIEEQKLLDGRRDAVRVVPEPGELFRVGESPNVEVRFVASEDAGAHETLYAGGRRTTVKDRRKVIGPGSDRTRCSPSSESNGTGYGRTDARPGPRDRGGDDRRGASPAGESRRDRGEAALREPSEWCGAPARPGRRRAGHTYAGRPVPGAGNAAGGRGVGRRVADGCRSGLKKAALGITRGS